MGTIAADNDLPADERPVRLVSRRDLQIDRVSYRQGTYWHVKDPLSLRYYQLRNEEYLILRLLDGRRSLKAIQREVETRFAPRRIELSHLQAFLGMLHREGLTVARTDGQGERLLTRMQSRRRQMWLAAAANPLAIRFRGINPSWMFDRLEPWTGWLFRPWLLLAGGVLLVAAIVLLLVHADALRDRLPDLQTFLSGRNVIWMAIALVAAKVVHEFAHGLTCRHFGGECHELGIMLLVFIPCLYCNVSDAWTLPSKWHRIAISGAGIVVELMIASICTFLWWFSAPGVVNSLCLNTVMICSVGTVFLNGNPLLRYDGYYILADYLEIPNLQQQATSQIQRILGRIYLNVDLGDRRLESQRRPGLLVAYGIASQVYRWLVVVGILWVCLAFFRNHGIAMVGRLLVILVVAGLLGTLLARGGSFLSDPRRRHQVDMRRFILSGSVSVVLVAIALMVPLPYHVSAPVMLQPAAAQPLYVTAPGTLDEVLVKAGCSVAAEQVLARLGNMDLEQEVLDLTGQRDLQRQHVDNLRRQQSSDSNAAENLPTALELLDSLDRQAEDRKKFQRRLRLRASVGGTVLVPRRRSKNRRDGELPAWSGTLLDPENLGCHVDVGTLFCLIGDAGNLEATLVIDQEDLELVRVGQVVRLQLSEQPGQVLTGHIRQVSEIGVREVPPELAASGELPVVPTEDKGAESYRRSSEARVSLNSGGEMLRIGAVGWARIRVEPQSLGQRFYRLIRHTFGFASRRPVRR